jgi:hypothetical protein
VARLVPLTVCYNIPEAHCLRAMLAAYGIPSVATAFHHLRNDWFKLVAFGGIDISVFEHDAEAARALILPVEGYVDDLESEPRAMLRAPLRVLAAIVFLYVFGAPAPLWVTKRRFLSEESA